MAGSEQQSRVWGLNFPFKAMPSSPNFLPLDLIPEGFSRLPVAPQADGQALSVRALERLVKIQILTPLLVVHAGTTEAALVGRRGECWDRRHYLGHFPGCLMQGWERLKQSLPYTLGGCTHCLAPHSPFGKQIFAGAMKPQAFLGKS